MKRREMPAPQGGVVKRTYAQVVLVCLGVGIVSFLVNQLIPYHTIPHPTMGELRVVDTVYRIKQVLRGAGISFCTLGAVWWIRLLRCPCCGLSFVMPWWSGLERHYCSRCGKEIVFDDTPPSH